MITHEQFEKAKQFIFRYGRLFDRKRFSFYFQNGSRDEVLTALMCYQNEDGGFGNGLEMDVLCPVSSPICTETAMYYLDDLGVTQGEVVDRLESWILASQQEDGTLPHPVDQVKLYPHGEWWLGDDNVRVLSLAGLLGRWGRGSEQFFSRVAEYFSARTLPDDLGIFEYPFYMYLRYAPGAEKFSDSLEKARRQIPDMLEKTAGHYPLFCPHWSYARDEISQEKLKAEAAKVIGYLQDDGGLATAYPDLPWWRPVDTLKVLVLLKRHGFLDV